MSWRVLFFANWKRRRQRRSHGGKVALCRSPIVTMATQTISKKIHLLLHFSRDTVAPMTSVNSVPAEKWLLLIHQLPAKPAYGRVKIWRRLQGLGRSEERRENQVLRP